MLQQISIIILFCFSGYCTYLIIKNLITYSRRRAKAWLAVARATTTKNPKEIEKVLKTHNKFLDKYIRDALNTRKIDLEMEIELNKELETHRKKNDFKRN